MSPEDTNAPYIELLFFLKNPTNSRKHGIGITPRIFAPSMSRITSIVTLSRSHHHGFLWSYSLTFSKPAAHYSPSCHSFLWDSNTLLIVVFVFCQALFIIKRIAAHHTYSRVHARLIKSFLISWRPIQILPAMLWSSAFM